MSRPGSGQQDRPLVGIGLLIAANLFFAVCDSCAKWMALSGMPPTQVAFGRYLLQLAFIAGLTMPGAGLSAFATSRPVLQVLRACGLMGMTVFNFFAVAFLPLTITSSISFGMPLLIAALSVPLLGEHVGWRRWSAILVGFFGILVIIRPWGADFNWAVLLSLGSITSGALYMILTRKLTTTESTLTLQLYAGLVGAVVLLPIALSNWTWPDVWWHWLVFAGVVLAAMTGHQIAIIAHRFAPASVIAPFAYSQIIWMTLSSWIVFHQPPSAWLFVGGPIVVGSGLYLWLRERQLAKARQVPLSTRQAETHPAGADAESPQQTQR